MVELGCREGRAFLVDLPEVVVGKGVQMGFVLLAACSFQTPVRREDGFPCVSKNPVAVVDETCQIDWSCFLKDVGPTE